MGVTYYSIDEEAARRANEMNSYFTFKPGYATERYRTCVDDAAKLAEEQKQLVDPMFHEKIDRLLDTYARKLAENWNDNPYFECETEGRIAAVYHDLMCEARPEYAEQHGDRAKEIALLTHELRYWGCGRIAVELAKLKGSEALPEPVRTKLSRMIRELTRYKDAVGPLPGRNKAKAARPQER